MDILSKNKNERQVKHMTQEAKAAIESAKTPNDKVKAVNQILKDGEKINVSVDSYSQRSGYKPQFVIDAMNLVFGVGEWGFEELNNEIVTSHTEKGDSMIATSQVRVWLKDVESKPTGWGQGRVTKGDIGDARKSAQTDAVKKALSYFSIGNRAYHGLLGRN